MMDIKVTAVMKAGIEKLSEDIIYCISYAIEVYRSFVLRAIESEDECGTMDVPRGSAYIEDQVPHFLCPCHR